MYARSTTITGRTEAIDECIAFVRDRVQPAVTGMDGCLGLSMVVDRASGRCIATSAWENEESLVFAEDVVAEFRARMAKILGGDPQVDRWEVALMHRVQPAGDGTCCRIVWARPQDLHVMQERFRSTILPQIETFDGFCSVSMLTDRLERRICTTTTFDSRAALDASRERALSLRERAGRETDVEFLEVAEFELALAHLRIPELV
ncbi:antibiotic biosynthesis monooxygenase [Nocardioides sp.]|uniref:antibiotic biosynthesis monooxygenase n=1 Tax=Nocardioides sp. TaxID=35761 RepID=UPI002D7EC26C|nr:antibiotic biosynthesis monooxygenase [Nocardioides sp.]HET8960960.1 antibiotic biosynthesis monooxygenase [Nocardioides sp.]